MLAWQSFKYLPQDVQKGVTMAWVCGRIELECLGAKLVTNPRSPGTSRLGRACILSCAYFSSGWVY